VRPAKALKRLGKGVRGRPSGPKPKSPTLAAGLIGLDVVNMAAADEWAPLDRAVRNAEELLADADPAIADMVIAGFIEGTHNAASHHNDETLMPGIRRRLPAGCAAAWHSVHQQLVAVEAWMRRTHQTIQHTAKVAEPPPSDLQRLFRINYWRTPDQGLIGVADALDYQRDVIDRAEPGSN
jgi:hypothetical protein